MMVPQFDAEQAFATRKESYIRLSPRINFIQNNNRRQDLVALVQNEFEKTKLKLPKIDKHKGRNTKHRHNMTLTNAKSRIMSRNVLGASLNHQTSAVKLPDEVSLKLRRAGVHNLETNHFSRAKHSLPVVAPTNLLSIAE